MKLQTRFVLIYGVGGVLFLYLVCLLIFVRMEQAMVAELREKFAFDARQRIASVQHQLADTRRYYQFSADLPMFQSMRYYSQVMNQAAVRDQVRHLELFFLELQQREAGLRSIQYIDADGREVLRIDNGHIMGKRRNLSQLPELATALRIPVGDYRAVLAVSGSGEAELVWWVPVSAAAGKVTGVLAFHVLLDALHRELRALVKQQDEQICLKDSDGGLLFSTREDVCNVGVEHHWQVSEPLQLRGVDWTMQVTADARPLLAEVYRLRRLVFGAILPVLALLGFTVAVVVSRHITRRVARVVTAARALGQDRPVPPLDESGSDEIAILAHEMNRAARLVRGKQEALSESNAELESYSYSIAHDLRTPLRSITSFAQLLQMEAEQKLNDEEKDFLARIIAAGSRMSELIDDILELSRISRLAIKAKPVDMSALARTVAAELAEHQRERRVDWFIEDSITAYGDEQLLRILLSNLLGNAWKYSKNQPLARIRFGVLIKDDQPVMFVADNGVGFDMRYVDKLFVPFQRLHDGGEFEGTGVGLATVQRIVKRHAGEVWVESEPARGTTIYFTLGLVPGEV